MNDNTSDYRLHLERWGGRVTVIGWGVATQVPARVSSDKRNQALRAFVFAVSRQSPGNSADCVGQLLASGVVQQGLANDFPGQRAAFAALAGDPQRTADIAKGAGATFDSRANLCIGNTLAETNVHEKSLVNRGVQKN